MIGGPATQCFHLCNMLLKGGDEPVVLTIGDRFECASPDGYRVYRYPWRYTRTPIDKAIRWVVFPWYFLSVVKREKPDVIHCHAVSALSFVAGALSRRKRIPSVIKFAGDWVWETFSTRRLRARDFDDLYRRSFLARLLWRVERRGLKRFAMIWAPSKFREENVRRVMGDVDNVRVIYNALDLPPGGLREMRPGDPFVVVSASRFIPHKRIPVIVRAFAALQDPHARLVLIGSGTNEQVGIAKAAVAEAGVGRQVTFLGKLDSLREADKLYGAFKQASVYVSASLEEGFPNVFVEAMHFGLPIVSTDVGGCREIVTDGRTGFLVDPADETGFARRLKELKENTERRNEMAEAAVEQSKRFELAAVLGQFKSLYAEAIRRTLSTQ